MSIDDIINGALSHIAPVIPDYCDTVDETVIVYNFSAVGDMFGDDTPEFDINRVMIHLYAPVGTDIKKHIKDIKTSLFEVGFSYPRLTNASDNQAQHYVFECEWCEDVSGDG